MKKSLFRVPATWIPACLVALGCSEVSTAPEATTLESRAATLSAVSARGGKPTGYVTHPLQVTFADRPGDDYTSDGGGSYTDEVDGRWVLTDYADPLRADHFQFHPGTGGSPRFTRLAVPGAVPPTDCEYFRFSVTDPDTPDLWSAGEGWSSWGSAILQCGQGRGEILLNVSECVAMTRGTAGLWTATADRCATEIWSGGGRRAERLGTFPVSFAFEAIEL